MNAPHAQPPQPPYAEPAPPKRGMSTGLVILLCTVGAMVLLVPVLSVLAVYGVRKYIANAKSAEARNVLVQIGKDAGATYVAGRGVCPSASQPVPSDPSYVRGRKYMSGPADWQVDRAANAGFACLGFSLDQPQYYQYAYTASADGNGLEAVARGDLDGDGALSTFTLRGSVTSGVVSVAPIAVSAPEE